MAGDAVIGSLDAATPRRLTRLLRDAELLNGERVTAVTVLQTKTVAGLSARLGLEFSGSVAPHVPRRVYLKIVTAASVRSRGRSRALREVEFYTSVAAALRPRLSDLGVVRCLDAAAHPDGPAHLVLQDVSDTHTQPEWPIPPSDAQLRQVVDWLAAFHATWWDDPAILGLTRVNVTLEWIESVVSRFTTAIADQVPAAEAARMRSIYAHADGMWRRGLIGPPPAHGFVLTHGDLHPWNVLYPVSAADQVAVIDWESWGIGHPMTEAAYLIGLNWDRSRDPAGERDMVQRYHRKLVASGRPSYSWDDCWRDYRLGVLALFVVPAVFWDRLLSAGVWWPQLRRLQAAYDQLHCDEVLDELR